MNCAPQKAIDDSQYREICEFLYGEAELLDSRQFSRWLELLDTDIRYRIAARTLRTIDAAPAEYPVIDDGPTQLRQRVRQISDPRLTYTENPPSSTRRFISNVRATRDEAGDRFSVASNIMLHRCRGIDAESFVYTGRRQDVLGLRPGGFFLVSRVVSLDVSVVPSMNLSVLF